MNDMTTDQFLAKIDKALEDAEQDFKVRFENFLNRCREFIERVSAERYPQAPKPTLEVERFKRFYRVVRHDPSYKSVQCFVDPTNGNVLPAKGWANPGRSPRANLFDASNGMAGLNVYGVHYTG